MKNVVPIQLYRQLKRQTISLSLHCVLIWQVLTIFFFLKKEYFIIWRTYMVNLFKTSFLEKMRAKRIQNMQIIYGNKCNFKKYDHLHHNWKYNKFTEGNPLLVCLGNFSLTSAVPPAVPRAAFYYELLCQWELRRKDCTKQSQNFL